MGGGGGGGGGIALHEASANFFSGVLEKICLVPDLWAPYGLFRFATDDHPQTNGRLRVPLNSGTRKTIYWVLFCNIYHSIVDRRPRPLSTIYTLSDTVDFAIVLSLLVTRYGLGFGIVWVSRVWEIWEIFQKPFKQLYKFSCNIATFQWNILEIFPQYYGAMWVVTTFQ